MKKLCRSGQKTLQSKMTELFIYTNIYINVCSENKKFRRSRRTGERNWISASERHQKTEYKTEECCSIQGEHRSGENDLNQFQIHTRAKQKWRHSRQMLLHRRKIISAASEYLQEQWR